MSMADTKPPRRQRQNLSKAQPALNGGAERLKTVIRRLPPNLPEEIFWQSVQAWVTDDTVTWKSYHPGKFRTKRMNKEGIPSRAYIAFKNEEQVATFSREYDGHLFRDKAGNESQAIVEFAPFQKIPTEKKKTDARTNTIDKDEDFLSFLESLKNAGKTESVSLETLTAASQSPPPPKTTPLLEALKAEKSAQRDKEAILRNHAHYKDAGATGAASKKEEAKKKAAAAQAAKQQPSEHAAPSSKKAKKAAAAAAAAAAQRAPSTQAQDGQGGPTGKTQPAGAAPPTAKSPTPASTTGHGARHRLAKESHGRAHASKGDTSAPSLSVPTMSGTGTGAGSGPVPAPTILGRVSPAPATTESAPPGSPGAVLTPAQRKSRPVIGLGRQFEAALNGAGVAVSQAPGPGGDRKKRDKGGEPGSRSGPGSGTAVGGHKGKHREDGPPAAVVPDVVIIQRPHSPKAEGGSGRGGGEPGAGAARGGTRRGRGRGRGPNRGG